MSAPSELMLLSKEKRVHISRQTITEILETDVTSLGASYTHIKSLKGIIGPSTTKIVMYHAKLDSLVLPI